MEEKSWEYDIDIIFCNKKIIKVTITDHYQINHSEITNELILRIVNLLNNKKLEPQKKHNNRDIYLWDRIIYQGKIYRLIFWFKDETVNHLWIRNCYQIY